MFLEKIDFTEMYKKHKEQSDYKNKNSQDWDNKSKEMASKMQNSTYVDQFISKMQLSTTDTVLDIGCGPGTLAIPLAKKTKHVIAIDFSKKMLDELESFAKKNDIQNITTYHLTWDDDWSVIPKVDIAVASRSSEVDDIQKALLKMSNIAKQKCYLTYKVGGSFVDTKILNFIDKKIITKPDFWYLPLILYDAGYISSVDYLPGKSGSLRYTDENHFVNSLIWSLGSLNKEQIEKAKEYYRRFLEKNIKEPKETLWAFISWDTKIS